MKDRQLKIIFGILAIILLVTLIFKFTNIPDGMILSGLFLGGLLLIGVLIVDLIISAILNLIFKKSSFLTLFAITTTFSFLLLHYNIYSPTLKITVPNGYTGEINLILSNVNDNILTIDENGIGYLNEWTFNKTYSKPIVKQVNGKNLENYLIGFNSSTFFAKSKSCCIENQNILSLTFKIGNKPNGKNGDFQHQNLLYLIDKDKVLLEKLDKHTIINSNIKNKTD